MSNESDKLKARILAAELNPEHELCPVCANGWIVHGTAAGDRFGVCPECYERGLRNAEYAAQDRAGDDTQAHAALEGQIGRHR